MEKNIIETKSIMEAMAESQEKYTIKECNGIINAIVNMYMVRGVEYGWRECLATFAKFLNTGEVRFSFNYGNLFK